MNKNGHRLRKFEKIWLHMLYEQSGTLKFDAKTIEEFYKNAVYFDLSGNIVDEDRNLTIDVPNSLIEFCYSNKDKLIPFVELKDYLKESKHYRSIKKDYSNSLYFSVFDFENDLAIASFHYKLFNITDDDELSDAVAMFKENVLPKSGIFSSVNNIDICLVNDIVPDIEKMMYHELSHYIQKVCNVRTLSKELKVEHSISKLNDIGITLDDFNYFISKNEFFTHIDELIVGLKNTYEKHYSKMTKFTFFYDIVLKTIMKSSSEKILQSDFVKNYVDANNREYASLAVFIASYWLNVKFQKIRDIVYESFKN